MAMPLLKPLGSLPSLVSEIIVVAGTHPAGAPAQVSRAYDCANIAAAPAPRLCASDSNATNRPSALIAVGPWLELSPSALDAVIADASRVVASQAAAPTQSS